jgi:hypothetical protein
MKPYETKKLNNQYPQEEFLPTQIIRGVKPHSYYLTNVYCGECGKKYLSPASIAIVPNIMEKDFPIRISLSNTFCVLCETLNQFYEVMHPGTKISRIYNIAGLLSYG